MKILSWLFLALVFFSDLRAQQRDATKVMLQKWLKEKRDLFYANRMNDPVLKNFLLVNEKLESIGVVCAPPAAVPQTLKVNAERVNEQMVQVNWQATTTVEVEGYILERSFEKHGPFERIAFLSNGLRSGGFDHYRFLDNNNFTGTSFYRVVQMQAAGRQKEQKVTAEGYERNLILNAFPNPSAGRFTLSIQSRLEAPVQLRVIDVLGRVVEQKNNLPANSVIAIGATYHSGVYVLEVQQGDKKSQLKLQKSIF